MRRLRLLASAAMIAALLAGPSSVLAVNPGPPDIEFYPPNPFVTELGATPIILPGSLVLVFDDGRQLSCVLGGQPEVHPPNPFCTRLTR
jgi:hypothetical protein